jgi:hypothetical protein
MASENPVSLQYALRNEVKEGPARLEVEDLKMSQVTCSTDALWFIAVELGM